MVNIVLFWWNETQRQTSVTSSSPFCITRWAIISSPDSGNNLLIHLLPASSTHPSNQSQKRRSCRYQVFPPIPCCVTLLPLHLQVPLSKLLCCFRVPWGFSCYHMSQFTLEVLHFFLLHYSVSIMMTGTRSFCFIWKPHQAAKCLTWSRYIGNKQVLNEWMNEWYEWGNCINKRLWIKWMKE